MILVESEHSAMSAAIGSAAAGARTITATSSAGFALMWEMVYVAASLRLPIQMALVNRALSGNINIHCDHSDSMGGRDAGWIHHFCENAQEAYDTALINFRISEHPDVQLPAMTNYDGFIISHKEDALYMLPDDAAWEFIGPYKPKYMLLNPAQADHGRPAGPDGLLLRAQVEPVAGLPARLRRRAQGLRRVRRRSAVVSTASGKSTAWTTPSW